MLSPATLQILDEVLTTSRASVPAALGSFPRSLSVYRSFKAADWKALLELFGTTLLFGHLSRQAYNNFVDLHDLWVMSTSRSISADDICDIKQKVTFPTDLSNF